jgi:hypothetical protein
MPVEQGPFAQIVNVHWGAPLGFLYSGADGMYGSKDGESWTRAPSSVRATALAWIDDVWIASGPGGCWRSEDGAESWELVSTPTAFTQLAAMLPKRTPENDEPPKAVFAAYGTDEESSNDTIYTSMDLGKTWSSVKTFEAVSGGEDVRGYEFVSALSGCNGHFFVGTIRGTAYYDRGSGWLYVSADGLSFSGNMIFGPGTSVPPDQPHGEIKGYGCSAVAFDEKTETYTLTGSREYLPGDGSHERAVIYSVSGSPSFSAGMDYMTVSLPSSIAVAKSLAGGDRAFASGITQFNYDPGPFLSPKDSKLTANFIPGSGTTLMNISGVSGTFGLSFVGSFCFNSMKEESTDETGEDEGEGEGIFACVAASSLEAGVYIAKAKGIFTKTHSGQGITYADGQRIAAAVAVGKIDFLESD